MSLATDRMLLRRFRDSDARALYALDNDPEVMRFINGGIATSMEHIVQETLPLFSTAEEGQFGFWHASLASTQEFVGWFSIRRRPADRAELGMRLVQSSWGLGLATEGATKMLEIAFAGGIREVFGTTYEDNVGSRRVMQKIGMSFVRAYRLGSAGLAAQDTAQNSGELWDGDDVEYAVDQAAWQAAVR